MTAIEKRECQKESAKRHFANHIATYSTENNIAILDWRKKSGSSAYYVRYVLDTEHCCLYITGDLGYAVVRLTERATLSALAGYINTVDYFVEKIQCSTDKYQYDEAVAKTELREHLLQYKRQIYDTDMLTVGELINNTMHDFDCYNGFNLSAENDELLSAICGNEYSEWLYNLGCYVCDRVILWLVGLNMAYEQLESELNNT